jgi:enoyl-CoA hydratase/carnithine racemase
VVEAKEAADLGLITRICENPFEAAADMAQEIADKSPDAIAAGKQLLEGAWHGSSADGLNLEASLQKKILGQANQIEAVMATFENRPPAYKNRN